MIKLVHLTITEMTLLKCVLITLCVSGCLCQRDCTGVDCPVLNNCMEEVLESGACCATCAQTGCTCEGYQYYDCVNAGFKNGKVPERDSYFVDYGSTECSCPEGGGRISCHFISCPEIPANCIEVSEPADGCTECMRIGCVHSGQKYEAGHSFHMDSCQVCHCPTDGGKLMCYPVPDCDPRNVQKPMLSPTTEENTHKKLHSDPYTFSQQGPVDRFSKPYRLSHNDKLPLFKPAPGHMEEGEEEDYDYDPTYTPDPYAKDLAVPTRSSPSNRVISVSQPDWTHRTSSHQGYDRAGKLELRESYGVHEGTTVRDKAQVTGRDRERATNSPVTVTLEQTTSRPREFTTSTWPSSTESQINPQKLGGDEEEEERVVTLKNISGPVGKDVPYDIGVKKQERHTPSSHAKWNGREPGSYHERTTVEPSTKSSRKLEQHTLPTVQFSPTSQPFLRLKPDGGQRPTKQPQTLFNPNSEDTEDLDGEKKEEEVRDNSPVLLPKPRGGPGVSAKDLVESCCEVGQRWAVEHNHCNHMPLLKHDKYSVCSVAQQQCCSGFLRENRCLAGMTAAREGDLCEVGTGDQCTEDSHQVCCSCCALGLRLRSEGRGCDAHNYLGYPCGHIFLTCCEDDDEEEEGLHQPSLKQKAMPQPSALPKKVSDSKFPKEAFSIGGRDEAENSVEEQPDVDECQLYQGQLCHHTCVNTWGSYRCDCHLGYTLLQDRHSCAPASIEEDNRVRGDDRPITEQSTTMAPTSISTIPPNPCAGNGPCMQQCMVVAGKAHCSCFPGFSLKGDSHTCEDVNECRTGTHNCSSGDYCVNKEGSFQCVSLNEMCDEGFIHTMNMECLDVNECVTNTHSCQPSERCVNTVGSFVCERHISCPAGYQLRNLVCEDIDECMVRTHNCGVGFHCENTEGSFLCNPRQKCLTGFTQDSHSNCIDVNECSSLSEPCSSGFNCINTVGSYTCQRKIIVCSQGYHSSSDGVKCVDVDECQTGIHRCGEGQICHNLPGSYRCDCQTGYQYDAIRQVCTDVNECWRYPGRLCAQTCENTPGSYQCSCTTGFSLAFDGKNCEDFNECDSNPCSQECANIYGSYQCYCRQGFYLKEDGHSCEDIDECSQSIGNLCAFECVNVPGSYQCACPHHGYTMSNNGRTCRDIDECTTGGHNCTQGQTCYNLQGGFRCLSFDCPQNYKKVSDTRCERTSCPGSLDCQSSPLRITYYQLSFQTNIIIPAQIFRIGPSPTYSGDHIVISITRGNEEGYFSTRKLNSFTGAVYLQRQVREPKDFLVDVEMKLLRQGTFTSFLARIYVFITSNKL
ncbi:fibulin-2 isoform X1 [Osmerus eperlanus]|uniref:fibulin-2 isoform X1 n=1 Tax=Osmerus eperlanus TaxID=29151 RepID=UPI002E163CFE